MDETDRITILEVSNRILSDRIGFPSRGDDPSVIVVLVVVACNLLLERTNGVRLDVRVEKASAVADVFKR